MDPSGDGGGGLTATGLFCGSCGTELPPNAKFCSERGTPVTQELSLLRVPARHPSWGGGPSHSSACRFAQSMVL
ncbi:zinc-ribbon domain-containing protein [Mycobacterium sp.]|uniref:zinc-ribbon domain-containing protein n=1 Tax=Mycobacterium sp. TaxID=1785 RepID=UPI003C71E276